jgi:hypothetical protein
MSKCAVENCSEEAVATISVKVSENEQLDLPLCDFHEITIGSRIHDDNGIAGGDKSKHD